LGTPAVEFGDLKRFRQLDSKCPGRPENRWTSGMECHHRPARHRHHHQRRHGDRRVVTGATFNRPGFDLYDYDVYAGAGDGCLVEGIGAEAASLAGHLKLSNLCWFNDNNRITIGGSTSLAFSGDVPARFAGPGWAVQHVKDANGLDVLSPRRSRPSAPSATGRR
jgi:transketolase